jgi:hypothetical protein
MGFQLVFIWWSGVGIGSHCSKVSEIKKETAETPRQEFCVLELGGMVSRWGLNEVLSGLLGSRINICRARRNDIHLEVRRKSGEHIQISVLP